MGALKQWVRDVLLILLLTHALELAIPFGASRRYVRLGAGLILLLALLQPMITLLRADFDDVLVQAADTEVIDAHVEARVGLVQDAQAAAASRIGYRLSEEAVAQIASRHDLRVERVEWRETGQVTIWVRERHAWTDDRRADGATAASAGVGEALFIWEAAGALGVAAQQIELRWLHDGEESR